MKFSSSLLLLKSSTLCPRMLKPGSPKLWMAWRLIPDLQEFASLEAINAFTGLEWEATELCMKLMMMLR